MRFRRTQCRIHSGQLPRTQGAMLDLETYGQWSARNKAELAQVEWEAEQQGLSISDERLTLRLED